MTNAQGYESYHPKSGVPSGAREERPGGKEIDISQEISANLGIMKPSFAQGKKRSRKSREERWTHRGFAERGKPHTPQVTPAGKVFHGLFRVGLDGGWNARKKEETRKHRII